MKSGGGATAVVTLAGTKNATTMGAVRIEATSATLFRWGYDNNGTTATWLETGRTIPLAGGSYALAVSGGLDTGLTATFGVGTYANGNTFEETVQDWTEQYTTSLKATQATATKQPRIVKDPTNGCYGVRGDATDDTLFQSTIDLPAQSGAAPVWVYMVAVSNANPTSTFNSPFAGNSALWLDTPSNTTIRMQCAGAGPVSTIANNDPMRIIAKFTGAGASDSMKVKATTGSVANTGNANSSAGLWICSNRDLGTSHCSWTIQFLYIRNDELTGTDLTNLETFAIARYGAGAF
jgi:hypothetical protein